MSDIPVDRAGRPMFDADGNELSIREREMAERIAELEKENAELNASIGRIVDKAIDQHVADLANAELPQPVTLKVDKLEIKNR